MIIGIETGGTKVVMAAAEVGNPEHPVTLSTVPTTSPTETLEKIAGFIAENSPGGAPSAIGVASFGPLDTRLDSSTYGRILSTPKHGWSNVDIVGSLTARFTAPIGLVTDVTGAVIGEHRWGSGRGHDDVAYLTVGTGIGVGAIVHGRIHAGTGYPEVAHVLVRRHPADTFAGVCRFHGDCVEGLASGPAIHARWGTDASSLAPDDRSLALEMEAFYLGQLLATIYYTLGSRLVVFGGGVSKSPGLPGLVAETANALIGFDYLAESGDGPLVVVSPSLGDLSGVTGALTLAQSLL
ncbi:ROK family protein [Subtercola sp. PAMC28395]|uniref:ROK family protein n=1 Tax=Subtercola sp. PAMC28395 TaxID=2846775 RepID=UPI001C0BD746|nr:ROK family protein [Subtercola sp. PAMC28395]QWT24143.1 ROK family protein [Subtercola sp. PAMC28395]